ncbi:MAG: manganese transporter [Gemmatimonadales bacterium]|nr:MAG: manganese transporter [Gemmatimonadales bacterium]
MRRRRSFLRWIPGGMILLAALVGCGEAVPGDEDGRLRVVATVGMITDIAERVGGDRVRVHGLMGPGVDPHLYKASAGDIRRLASADLILYNGLHLEAAMADLLEQMDGRTRTRAVTADIDPSRLLRPAEFEGAYDPHVWSDVSLWMVAVETVVEALSELDPEGEGDFRANADLLLEELEELDRWIQAQVARVPEHLRVLVTAHDAFNYFGRAYGFEVRGLQGLSTVTEAGAGDVQDLAGFIVRREIPALFVESSIPTRNVEAVQAAVRSRGFEVAMGGTLFSDAMGDAGTPEGTYPGMIRHNVRTIVEALAPDVEEEP